MKKGDHTSWSNIYVRKKIKRKKPCTTKRRGQVPVMPQRRWHNCRKSKEKNTWVVVNVSTGPGIRASPSESGAPGTKNAHPSLLHGWAGPTSKFRWCRCTQSKHFIYGRKTETSCIYSYSETKEAGKRGTRRSLDLMWVCFKKRKIVVWRNWYKPIDESK